MGNVLIYADTREVGSNMIDHFAQYDCEVQRKMLLYGDFLVSDRVCIERKTAQDFLSSIVDKRLFQQLKDMKENYEKPVLIIEGNDLYGRLHPNAVRGALASIALDFGIPIIWTKDIAETVGMVYWFARREQIQENRSVSFIEKRKASSLKDKQELLIHGLPGVSIVRAQSLLKHFKTPAKIFRASEKELEKVENIGKVTAKRIREVLTGKYL